MKKGTALLTALLTASFLVACENKGGEQPKETQQPQTTEQQQQTQQQPQQEEQKTEETNTNEANTEGQTQQQEEQATQQEGAQQKTNQNEGQPENTNQGNNTEQPKGEQQKQEANLSQGGENGGGNIEKGKQLFTANGCTACHQEKADSVGPALAKIAQAYAGKKEDLIKFLKGEGKSIVDPAKFAIMQPNLAKTKGMSGEDLSALADYILSVK